MKLLSKAARFAFAACAIAILVAMLLLPRLNKIQSTGVAPLAGLDQSVSVVRDKNGMAYVRAATLLDAIRAQGYVTAQDRLFQLHLTRIAVSGRLAELFGEELLDRDKRQRLLGFYRAAEQHASLLDRQSRRMFQAYADGVNAYINNPDASHPIELQLAGVPLEPWRIVDSLAVLYYMGWGSAADLNSELLSQAIISRVGLDRFREMAPLNSYPYDDQNAALPGLAPNPSSALASNNVPASAPVPAFVPASVPALASAAASAVSSDLVMQTLEHLACCAEGQLALGSNNWALSGNRSPGGKPIVANDPHLESTLLPSTLYPVGLFTPDLRAVGVNVPGLPGIIIGRNQYIAAGATNAYADAQDVYIETIDPDIPQNYLEGDKSIPFRVIEQSLKVRDKSSDNGYRIEPFEIRLTSRGPVISDLADTDAPDTDTPDTDAADSDRAEAGGKVLSVRWSPYESMRPRLGLDFLLYAKSVDDVRASLEDATAIHLNLVFADTLGQMGWQVTGRIPIRRNNDGSRPLEVVDSRDNWVGWVPYAQMPSSNTHPQGWVGTANNRTVADNAPYFYSNYASPDYRIRRMQELFDSDQQVSAEQHWQAMRDDLNLLARDVVPVMVKALRKNNETEEFGHQLAGWDFHDRAEAAAPLIFQEIWRRMIEQTFADDLGDELAGKVNRKPYFWSQRMRSWVLDGGSSWFDDNRTENVETLEDVIQAAAVDARRSISQQLGDDIADWLWGDLHRLEILNPLRRSGIGKGWLGTGSHAMGGSSQTLYRGSFDLSKAGNQVVYSAALRMVADLSDDEKVVAVIPGGVSGRMFDKHFVDQIDEYLNGEKIYWWFDDSLIDQHAQSVMTLLP